MIQSPANVSRTGNSPPSADAFTLLELMVVTAVLAVVAGLIFLALVRPSSGNRTAGCRDNLLQLQRAWLLYIQDHNDELPPNISRIIAGAKQAVSNSWVRGNAYLDATSGNLQAGVLFQYTPGAHIYRCPADRSMVQDRPGMPRTRSYALTCWLHGVAQTLYDFRPATVPEDKNKYSQIVDPPPSQVFTFMDEHEQSIDDGSITVARLPDQWFDLPADRHKQGANIAFADGHVETWRWHSPKQFRSHRQTVDSPADREDFERLKKCIPNR